MKTNPRQVAWLGLALFVSLVATPAAAQSLDEKLAEATQLNFAGHWQHARGVLDSVGRELGKATLQQQIRHSLELATNMSLAGETDAGLMVLEELLDRHLEPAERLNALWLSATLATMARQYELAFAYLQTGLELRPQVDDPTQIAGLLGIASQMHAQVGEYEQSIALGHSAVEYARQSGSIWELCIARQRLASAYRSGSDRVAIESYLLTALEVCEQAGNQSFMGAIEYSLANLMIDMNRLDRAEPFITRALDRLQELGYGEGLAVTRLVWARYLIRQNDIGEAETILLELLDKFRDSAAWDHLAESYELLGEIAAQRGDYKVSLSHQLARIEARKKFLDRDRARRLAYLQVAFNMSAKEQEINLLREQARVRELQQQTRDERKRLQGYGVAGGGVLLLALACLLVHASRERRHFRSLSRRDGLTGLYNHTRFFEQATEALRKAYRNGQPTTLVLADIDHFKQVNDRHGHQCGDQVLGRVAGRLREVFGEDGCIGRVGGEEFAIILPGDDAETAAEAIDRLRENLNKTRAGDSEVGITISFGLAEARPNEDIGQLRQRADRALYEAKDAGRNKVRTAAAVP